MFGTSASALPSVRLIVTKICHFLLIEDDRDEAFLVERAFSKVPNCSFALCRNLSEAKAYLRGAGVYANRKLYALPQVILSDLNIGPDSGVELLEWCRKEDEFRATPLIIFTGSANPSEIQNAFREGAQDVIQKPFNNEALVQTLKSLAEKFCR
jgi:CheY-like chemotaxis protein